MLKISRRSNCQKASDGTASAPRQPTVPVDCADRQADDIGQPTGGFVGAAAAATLHRAL
jgi:hypothetical protein